MPPAPASELCTAPATAEPAPRHAAGLALVDPLCGCSHWRCCSCCNITPPMCCCLPSAAPCAAGGPGQVLPVVVGAHCLSGCTAVTLEAGHSTGLMLLSLLLLRLLPMRADSALAALPLALDAAVAAAVVAVAAAPTAVTALVCPALPGLSPGLSVAAAAAGGEGGCWLRSSGTPCADTGMCLHCCCCCCWLCKASCSSASCIVMPCRLFRKGSCSDSDS